MVVNIEWSTLILLFIFSFSSLPLGNSSYLVWKASWMGRCSGGLWQEDGHKQRWSWADAGTDALLGSTWWMVRGECLKTKENCVFLFSGCCHSGAYFLPEFLFAPTYFEHLCGTSLCSLKLELIMTTKSLDIYWGWPSGELRSLWKRICNLIIRSTPFIAEKDTVDRRSIN